MTWSQLPRWHSSKESSASAGDAEILVPSLGWEDAVEEGMATHLGILTGMAQLVKNPPAMQEPLLQFLSQEDPLEKG